ncbi:MarR family transcriptional regulator [Alcaligenes faecalis]|nr:MarR family transcriptional regulator [Alcaligenes faecalis]
MPNKQPLRTDWTEPEARDEVLSGHMQSDIVRMMLRQFDVYLEANKTQLAQAAGLSLNEYKALEFVLEFKPLSPGKLAQLLDLSPSGTQALITRLESAGYLLRKPHPRDGRMTILYPNQERCKRLITDMNLPAHHIMDATAHYNPKQLAALYDFLFKSLSHLRKDALERLKHKPS